MTREWFKTLTRNHFKTTSRAAFSFDDPSSFVDFDRYHSTPMKTTRKSTTRLRGQHSEIKQRTVVYRVSFEINPALSVSAMSTTLFSAISYWIDTRALLFCQKL